MLVAKLPLSDIVIRPLRTEADYENAIATVEGLWGAEPETPEGDHLDVLLDLVEAYEIKFHPIDLPDPIEAIKIRMDNLEINRTDLSNLLQVSSGRVSEILNRRNKRKLTLPMIRTLAHALGLSFNCLCQPYDLEGRSK